jgi:trans-L-3-hydroxyproline dehydratase
MCGHGIIAVTKVVLDCGLVPAKNTLHIDTPAGRVTATAEFDAGVVERVSFRNVPSFVLHTQVDVNVPTLGLVRCDVAFGGAFYAVVDGTALGLDPERPRPLIDAGMAIKHAVAAELPIVHPTGDADLNFLYGTIFVWPGQSGVHSRNVCIFADGEVDRSPTGTGVSARAAIHHARGEVALNETLCIESIIGTRFDVRIVEQIRVGELNAVVPEVSGKGYITGRHEFLLDPADPLLGGLFLR